MSPDLSFWARWLATLAAESFAILLLAALLAGRLAAARHRRMVWLAAFWATWVVVFAEGAGVGFLNPISQTAPSPQRSLLRLVASPVPASSDSNFNPAPLSSTTPSPGTTRLPTPATWWPGWVCLAGTAVVLAIRVAAHARAILHRRRHGRAAPSEAAKLGSDLARRLGLARVRLVVLPGLRSPIAYGVLFPGIAVPDDFCRRFDPTQQAAVLLHELGHLARRDPLALVFADLTGAVLWWHPGMAWARRRLEAAMEAAADEASSILPEGPVALAESLIQLARDLTSSAMAGPLGVLGTRTRSQLSSRVHALVEGDRRWRRGHPLAPVFSILAASGTALGVAIPVWPGTSQASLASYLVSLYPRSASSASSALESPSNPITDPIVGMAQALAQPHSRTEPEGRPASNPPSAPPPAPVGAARSEAAKLEVKILEITEQDSDSLGLDWLFGHSQAASDPVETGRPKPDEPASRLVHAANIVMDRSEVEGQSVVLEETQVRALLARLEALGNVAITTCPPVEAKTDAQQVQVQILDQRTVVTGVKTNPPPAAPGFNYITESVGVGPTIDILTTHAGDHWRLVVLGAISEFLGYDDPGLMNLVVPVEGGPLTAQLPLPRLRVRKAIGEGSVAAHQSLLVRGPAMELKERVKGGWLRKARDVVRQVRLYLIVTLAPDSGD